MTNRRPSAFAAVLLLLTVGCATYPVNPRLAQYDPKSGYRYENLKGPENSMSRL
jgi:NTE family protein